MLKKVPKVAVLRSICSDVVRDSVYSNEMHSVVPISTSTRYLLLSRENIDHAKATFEKDVKHQNMEIANLKDALLEARRASKGQEIYTQQLENVREHECTRAMIKRENALVNEMNRLRTEIAHEQRVNMEVKISLFSV